MFKKNIVFVLLFIVTSTFCQQKFTTLFEANKKDSVKCYRIPALVTAKNGDLIAAIDERVPHCGDLRYSKNINIVVRRSSDSGHTWLTKETVVDLPYGESVSDPSMIVDKMTGSIFMFYNYMNLNYDKGKYFFHYVKSDDNGKTWSKPKDITSMVSKDNWNNDFKFITSGRGICTSKGWLLHTIVNIGKGLFVFGSKDHGDTWELFDSNIGMLDEAKLLELDDTTVIVNARVNKKGKRVVLKSKDLKEWSSLNESQDLIDSGCNASIIRYETNSKDKKSIYLFANPKSKDKRVNLSIRVSYDGCKSWSEGKIIYRGSSAYSSLSVLKNGEIGVFFEKDDYTKNVFTSFPLKWVEEIDNK